MERTILDKQIKYVKVGYDTYLAKQYYGKISYNKNPRES
jgi:hypothetical protein